MRIFFLILAITQLVYFSFGCSWFTPRPQMSQLQVRELQTRTFAVKDTKQVLKAVIATLQDDGFMVKNTDSDLGFVSASKEIDLGGDPLFAGKNDRWNKTSTIETTANVDQFGKECKVRISFQKKILDNMGAVTSVAPVIDPKFYQDFFMKVDKAVFLSKEKL